MPVVLATAFGACLMRPRVPWAEQEVPVLPLPLLLAQNWLLFENGGSISGEFSLRAIGLSLGGVPAAILVSHLCFSSKRRVLIT